MHHLDSNVLTLDLGMCISYLAQALLLLNLIIFAAYILSHYKGPTHKIKDSFYFLEKQYNLNLAKNYSSFDMLQYYLSMNEPFNE